MNFDEIVLMIERERARQAQLHDNSGASLEEMANHLISEVGEFATEVGQAREFERRGAGKAYHGNTVAELVQVAAMAIQILEGFDGRDFHF